MLPVIYNRGRLRRLNCEAAQSNMYDLENRPSQKNMAVFSLAYFWILKVKNTPGIIAGGILGFRGNF